jgi:hypothetical protein
MMQRRPIENNQNQDFESGRGNRGFRRGGPGGPVERPEEKRPFTEAPADVNNLKEDQSVEGV